MLMAGTRLGFNIRQLMSLDRMLPCSSRNLVLTPFLTPHPAQDTRRMYQDELDMMEIELLGRERQTRLAAERAAAETSGRAELARVQTSLQVPVHTLSPLNP